MAIATASFSHQRLHAELVTIAATVDGAVDVGSSNPGVFDAGTTISTSRNFTVRDRYGIFEWDLTGIIPDGATITSAKFSGFTTGIVDTNYDISLYSYTDNGSVAITSDDVSRPGTLIGAFGDGSLANNSAFELNFNDVSGLQSAIDNGNVFGIRSSMVSNQDTWTIRSIEDSNSTPPILTINFSAVPEPSSCLLLGFALGSLAFRRRD